MRFILFVEGYTEAEHRRLSAYLKRWLDPRLAQPVGLPVVRFDGWPELVKDAPFKARMHLEGAKAGEVLGVIGLMDLYGPTIYPPSIKAVPERFAWIKQHMEQKVSQAKFRQFCAVHETEAWLLSQPDLFPRSVREAFPDRVQKPETVNFDEPPARLLARLYRQHAGRTYKKRVDGPNLFDRADPQRAYVACPYFKQMLDEMLAMARAAGL